MAGRNRYGDLTDDTGDPIYQLGSNQLQTQNTGVSGYGPGGTPTPGLQGLPPLTPTSPGVWQGNQPGATTWNAGQGWTGTSAVGGPQNGDYQSWFMNLVGGRPWNQQTLNSLMPTLQQYGIKLTPPNASGDQTKIQLPDGTWVRVGFGEGHPVWIPQTNTGMASGAMNPFFGAGGTIGSQLASSMGAPPPFQAPTLADLQATPGYQARMQMGQQALERSAAAKGTLLSGGFQQALNRYAQNYASNEYQNAFSNALSGYGTNVFSQSQLPWQRYQDLLGVGLTAAGQAGQAGKVPPVTG